jgi:succinyl-diaminopimelate desuccinylase
MQEEHIDFNPAYLMEKLRDLVAFKTVAPPGSCYHEIVDYLVPIFEGLGFETEKILIPPEIFQAKCKDQRLVGDRVNLRAHLNVGGKETLIIYTHLDVVPSGDKWSTDPFQLTMKEGRVYGRGVSDSKGAVAGLLAALQALKGEIRYNLTVLLTTDEEAADYSGLVYLADEGQVKGDCMLCMDGYSDDVVIGSNGVINWEAVVHGTSVHSGYSFMGVNAIERSIPVMEALMDLKRKVQSRTSSLAACSAFEEVGIVSLMPVLNITMISGGIKENIVPDKCALRGDRRIIPEESMEEAIAEIEETIRSVDVDVDLRFMPGYPPMWMNPDHHWVEEVRRAVERVRGTLPKLSGTQGSLDQAYVTDLTKIPTCVYGVGRQLESNAHGADENARVEDLYNYARFMISLLAPGRP